MKINSILAILFITSLLATNSFAQSEIKRRSGYYGNITITDHLGVFVGLETSHGYMFDKHNYLGAGVGGFILPNNNHPTYMNTFLDYHCYLKEKNSFVLGMKAGWSHAFNYNSNSGIKFKNGILIEPNIGGSWLLKSGNGLILGFGVAMIFPVGDFRTDKKIFPLPKISFGFEF